MFIMPQNTENPPKELIHYAIIYVFLIISQCGTIGLSLALPVFLALAYAQHKGILPPPTKRTKKIVIIGGLLIILLYLPNARLDPTCEINGIPANCSMLTAYPTASGGYAQSADQLIQQDARLDANTSEHAQDHTSLAA